MNEPIRVVKLGGSLLDWDALPQQLRRWLALGQPARTLLVVGGGRWVDAVRREDVRRHLDERTAHWTCIDAMSVTARLVADWIREAVLFDDVGRFLASSEETPLAILDVGRFLRDVEPAMPGDRLPESWDVTSDSIAARVARIVGAAELVLLKSALPDGSASPQAMAEAGYVDRFYPRAAASLPRVRCVHLRSDGFDEVTILCRRA